MANSSEELIMPKKLANPVKESSARRELHRELMFNQKIGKNVLNQKSELQRVMESKGFNLKSVNSVSGSIHDPQGGSSNEFIHVHRKITSHTASTDCKK